MEDIIKRNYLLRQGILVVPTFFLITFISFAIVYFAPGEVGQKLLQLKTGSHYHSSENLEAFIERTKIPKNTFTAYKRWLAGIFKSDLGQSVLYGEPVKNVIFRYARNTISLVAIALIFYLVPGVYIGFKAGIKPGGLVDSLSHLWATANLALPMFWVATVVLWLVTKLFPDIPVLYFAGLNSLWVPGILMGLLYAGNLMKLLRDRVLRISEAEFVAAARVMGLSSKEILWKHIFTNALPTIISVTALDLSSMLMGSLLIEKIFSIPGIGSLLIESINVKDYFLIAGCVFYICIVVAFCNLLAEIIYPLIDRRRT